MIKNKKLSGRGITITKIIENIGLQIHGDISIASYLGRKVIKQIDFDIKGTFNSYHAACSYLCDNGYSHGDTCAMQPVGLLKGKWYIRKWKNLSKEDIAALDGVMIGDTREGKVCLLFFN